jgi:hypothetical protein
MRSNVKRSERKAKKSYTLSPESVTFLETLRKRRRAASISSVLEESYKAFADNRSGRTSRGLSMLTIPRCRTRKLPSTPNGQTLPRPSSCASHKCHPTDLHFAAKYGLLNYLRIRLRKADGLWLLYRWTRGIAMNGPTRSWLFH